jgi:hypothetical protein
MGRTPPGLSVVVTIISDTVAPATADQLRSCLRPLVRQADPAAGEIAHSEIIVPHYPGMAAIAEVRAEFPQVRFLEVGDLRRYTGLGSRQHQNELRARGIAAAEGDIIALTDDYSVVDAEWCARIVEAHRAPMAGVGGAIENGAGGLLAAALCFCDFAAFQNPLHKGEPAVASDVNSSYKRTALEAIRPVWEDVFEEFAVHGALAARGEKVIFSPAIVVHYHRVDRSIARAWKERFIWGRSFGRWRKRAGIARIVWAGASLIMPAYMLARMALIVAEKRRNGLLFCRALPLTAWLTGAWCLGEMTGYLGGAEAVPALRRTSGRGVDGGQRRVSVVVVNIADGQAEACPTGTLDALGKQSVAPFEIIVPGSGFSADVRGHYPAVRFLACQPEAPPGSSERAQELRAMGVAAAQGEIVALTENHVRPDPGWTAAILEAHRQPYAAIGGAVENGLDGILSWATYFADLGRYHNPLPAGPSQFASVVNVSYKRERLDSVRQVWKHRFHETAVHAALMASGETLALSPGIVVRQYRPDARLGPALREFFIWGRSFGATRRRQAGAIGLVIYVCLSPLIPVVLLTRSALDVFRKRRLVGPWLKSLPLSAMLVGAWSCGELTGYLAGEPAGH